MGDTVQILLHVGIILACHRAEYQRGQECCPMCPPGARVNEHCTDFRSTSCLPCDEGTYMDNPTGMTQCFSCQKICAPGAGLKVKTKCSTISNTVCEAQEGHFCEQQSEGSCVSARKHRRCEPGEFIPSADTVCSPCDEGTFSNGTLSKCQPHTQCEQMDKVTITAGTMFSDAECGERNNTPLVIGILVICLIPFIHPSIFFHFSVAGSWGQLLELPKSHCTSPIWLLLQVVGPQKDGLTILTGLLVSHKGLNSLRFK
uniref:TNFR-Cys domain-containing protein n=1 Tax=Neogobius melanostomus TaxID=47308 RepID=A0A8C6UBR8_9GOBI